MGLDLIQQSVRDRFRIEERGHACALLATDLPQEFNDLVECLDQFELVRSEIAVGGKSKIAARFDDFLYARGWREKSTAISMTVDGVPQTYETHQVDLWKNRVAVEVEWNNKDPFFSRDLNAFRLLHELGIISAGIIITRDDDLQGLFDSLGYVWDAGYRRWKTIGSKYGQSTTHWGKLIPRVASGGAGRCPLLLVGIGRQSYRDDIPETPIINVPPLEPPS